MEAIANMTLGELSGWATLALVAIFSVVQISPIQINPWTWLARKIGSAINGEVLDEVNSLKEDIGKVKSDVRKMKEDEDERDAKAARTRVLRFGDELIHDVHHSKEHFDDILHDISDYERYCREHPDFENDRMQLTSHLIKDCYRKCMEEHSFL